MYYSFIFEFHHKVFHKQTTCRYERVKDCPNNKYIKEENGTDGQSTLLTELINKIESPLRHINVRREKLLRVIKKDKIIRILQRIILKPLLCLM